MVFASGLRLRIECLWLFCGDYCCGCCWGSGCYRCLVLLLIYCFLGLWFSVNWFDLLWCGVGVCCVVFDCFDVVGWCILCE